MYEQYDFCLVREALGFLVKKYGIKQMHIPYYLCDAVRHTLVACGCKPLFYHIDDNFYPVETFTDDDYALYPNYFGICRNNAEKLVSIYPKMIIDNAHAYYERPSGFACFNAGHKFCLPSSKLYIKKDDTLQNYDLTKEDIKMAEERLNLFMELHNSYGQDNLLNIDIESVSYPCIYPFLAESEKCADGLVKDLKRKGKTIFRYWSHLPHNFNEYKFYSRLVPVPVLPFVE